MTFREKLEADRAELIDQINNPNYYNIRFFFKRGLANCKLAMVKLVPYVVAIAMTFPSAKALGKTPFLTDKISQEVKIEIIDSSNGDHFEGYTLKDDLPVMLEYSTGWKFNEYHLYERTQTRYILTNIDINDHETIFSLSKEELDAMLIPMEEQVITKTNLTSEDLKYNQGITTIHNLENTNTYIKIDESLGNNVLNTVLYILICLSLGTTASKIGKVIFHDEIENKIMDEKKKYSPIDDRQMKKLQKRLELIESDLELFNEGKAR